MIDAKHGLIRISCNGLSLAHDYLYALFRGPIRERVVILLADVDQRGTEEVLQRLISDFNEQYPSMADADFDVRCVEVKPGLGELSVKDVLKDLFTPPSLH